MTKASNVVFVFFFIFMGTLEKVAHRGQLGRVGDPLFLSHVGCHLSTSFCPVMVTCNTPSRLGYSGGGAGL